MRSTLYTEGDRLLDNLTLLWLVEVAERWARIITAQESCLSVAYLKPEAEVNNIDFAHAHVCALRGFILHDYPPLTAQSLFISDRY